MFLTKSGRHKAPGGRNVATKLLITAITGVMLAGASIAPAYATQPTDPGNSDPKVWVCKIVRSDNAPGGYELKAGKNPIHVSANALDADVNPVPGAPFSDAQPSFVVAEDNVQLCLNGLPKGDATGTVDIEPATCELGEKVVISGVSGATASGTANGTYGPGDYSVTFTANAGYTFPGGNTLVFSGTLAGPLDPSNPACAPPPVDVDYVTVAWEMPSWVDSTTPTWPQSYVTSINTEEPNLNALDDQLNSMDCKQFQVDVYIDNEITAALIAGGVLYGPGNPPESLIPGGWGVAYKLLQTGNCPDEEPEQVTPQFPTFSPDCVQETGEFSILFIAIGTPVDGTPGLYENDFSYISVTVGETTASATVTPKDGYVLAPPTEGGVEYVLNEDGSVTYSVDFTAFAEECGEDEEPQFIVPPAVGASYDCINEEIVLDLGGATLQEDGSYRWEFGSFRVNVDSPTVTFSFLTDPGYLFPEPGEGDNYTLVQGEGELGSDAVIVIDLSSEIEACDDVEPVKDFTAYSFGDCVEGEAGGFSGGFVLTNSEESTEDITHRVVVTNVETDEVVFDETEVVAPGTESELFTSLDEDSGEYLFEQYVDGELYDSFPADSDCRPNEEEPEEGDLMVVVTGECLTTGGSEVTVTATNTTDDVQTVRVGIEEDEEFLLEFDVNPGETEVRTFVLPNGFGDGTATIYAGDANAPVAPQPVEVSTNCPPPVVPPVDPPKNPEPPVKPEPPAKPPVKPVPPVLAQTGAGDMNGGILLGGMALLAGLAMMLFGRRHAPQA